MNVTKLKSAQHISGEATAPAALGVSGTVVRCRARRRHRWTLLFSASLIAASSALAACSTTATGHASLSPASGSPKSESGSQKKAPATPPAIASIGHTSPPTLRVRTSINAGPTPIAIAIAPDGRTAYVSNGGGSAPTDTVTVVNLIDSTISRTIAITPAPGDLALTHDGATLYVVGSDSQYSDVRGSLTPIDTTTGAPGTPISVGNDPSQLIISKDGTHAYVLCTNFYGDHQSSIFVVDLSTAATVSIPAGLTAGGMAISPDRRTAYVASQDGTVTPVSLLNRAVGAPIDLGKRNELEGIAVSADGARVYVLDVGTFPGTVVPLDLKTGKLGTSIPAGNTPQAIAISPDGEDAYVSSGTREAESSVRSIDLSSGKASRPVRVGEDPVHISLAPSGKVLYTANFDASGTITPVNITP